METKGTTSGGAATTAAATAPATTDPTSYCKLMNASIDDEIFNRSDCCLVVNQNCLSYKNYGRCANIVEKYTYADVAGVRQPDHVMKSFANIDDWGKEGDAILKDPPLYTEGPSIATLITQFGIGRPYEENNISQKVVKYCKDMIITSRLRADTLTRRIAMFNKSVFRLAGQLSNPEYVHIKKVIFPVGVGRSGAVDDVWLSRYLTVIYAFACDMERLGKDVFLLTSKYILNEMETMFENRNDRFTLMYKKLKNHPIVEKENFLLDDPLPSYRGHLDDDDDDEGYDVPDTQTCYILPECRF